MKLYQLLKSSLLGSRLKATVISVACAPFPTMLFPSGQLSIDRLRNSTLQTANPFHEDLLWLTVLVEGGDVSSLHHDCGSVY